MADEETDEEEEEEEKKGLEVEDVAGLAGEPEEPNIKEEDLFPDVPEEEFIEEPEESPTATTDTESTLVKDVQQVISQSGQPTSSYKQILIEQFDKSVQRAFEKAEEVRVEKEKEMASFVRTNEKLQEMLKDLWTKAHKFNLLGQFSMCELFNECYGMIEEQSEIIKTKQKMPENPYAGLLDYARPILQKLLNEMKNFQVVNADPLESNSDKQEAYKKFMDAYYNNEQFIRRFIKHTLSGTIIMTERWKGREEVVGKPRGF